MARHDENKDLRLVSKIANINSVNRIITISKGTLVGIRLLGRLDYLAHYCNWTVVWVSGAVQVSKAYIDSPKYKRDIKKENKFNSKMTKKKK